MALTAIDLFAGAGGATSGLVEAGFDVVGAIEIDQTASQTYRLNHPETRLWTADIRRVPAATMLRELGLKPRELSLLKSCPPCQGFSSLAEGRVVADEERNDLVLDTLRFVRVMLPKAVLVENVTGLGRDARLPRLEAGLKELGYQVAIYRVNAADFGVPQRRRRLILLAIRGRKAVLPPSIEPPVCGNGESSERVTVRAALDALAGELRPDDALNRHRNLSDAALARVQAIPVGGSRFDLPDELQLACHRRVDRSGVKAATGSYGRLRLDEPGPTMTTRCTTPACGPFVHPLENRGLTLREAATLQTFPPTYQFSGGYDAIERQIGNAVPVRLAMQLGRLVSELVAS